VCIRGFGVELGLYVTIRVPVYWDVQKMYFLVGIFGGELDGGMIAIQIGQELQ
jgi:hypothetical protein